MLTYVPCAAAGGSFFNFAGFGKKGESELKDLQTKEIKNGRLVSGRNHSLWQQSSGGAYRLVAGLPHNRQQPCD